MAPCTLLDPCGINKKNVKPVLHIEVHRVSYTKSQQTVQAVIPHQKYDVPSPWVALPAA